MSSDRILDVLLTGDKDSKKASPVVARLFLALGESGVHNTPGDVNRVSSGQTP